MATTDFNGTQTLYVSKDPLAGLSAPVDNVKDVTEFRRDITLPITFIQESMRALTEEFDVITTAAKNVEAELRKVIECYGCEEYAFDGTLTTFATDEGGRPFCPECVRAIEKRSQWQEETALPFAWNFKELNSASPSTWRDFTAYDYSVPSTKFINVLSANS